MASDQLLQIQNEIDALHKAMFDDVAKLLLQESSKKNDIFARRAVDIKKGFPNHFWSLIISLASRREEGSHGAKR